MTITANDSREEYTASAGQTVFNYTFRIYTANDLNVYVTPSGDECAETDLITAYVVDTATIDDPAGGFITLNVAASAGDLITINSAITENRATDYQTNGDFIPATVNADFDRVVSLIKQLKTNIKRAPQFIECSQGTTAITMDPPEALQYPRWKSDLSGLENVDLASSGLPTTADLISYTPLGIGAAVSDVQSRLRVMADIRDHGATGDDSTDDRANILSIITAVSVAGGGVIMCQKGDYRMGKDGSNFYSILMPSNITMIGQGEDLAVFKAFTADSDYQLFRCGGTHGSRENIHFRDIGGDMRSSGTPVDNGAEFIRFSNCTNFSAVRVKALNANGAGVRADGYGAAGSNNDWYKSAPNYATDWGQSSNFELNNITTDNCYLGVEVEGGAKEGTVLDGNHTNVEKFGVRLTSADTVTAARNVTDTCEVGVWVDRSYNCHVDKNTTLNYSQHAIAIAFLQGGSVLDNDDDGSGVLGTNHAINDSFHYVEADYTGAGLGAGSLRQVEVKGNKSTNRIFMQHAIDVDIINNDTGIDAIRPHNGRVNISGNKGSLVESDLDFNSVRNGERHKELVVSSVVGTFTTSDTVTGGTSAATGVVLSVAATKLHIKVRTGTFAAAETITGSSSGATATVDSISSANVLVTHQTNSDNTVSRFSMLQGPSCSAFAIFKGDGGVADAILYDSFNCIQVQRTGTGVYKMHFVNDFANADSVGITVTPTIAISFRQGTTTTGDVIIETFNSSGVATDAGRLTVLVYGELAT